MGGYFRASVDKAIGSTGTFEAALLHKCIGQMEGRNNRELHTDNLALTRNRRGRVLIV